ncbi:MAG: alpha-N-arabinofuranosidase [Candidatus Acidiferrales bacterium]
MKRKVSRREFVTTGAAASLAALAPGPVFADSTTMQRQVVYTDAEIGKISPELHGHFAEHLGSCVYGGLWVGKNSKVPNINGHRKLAVEYLRELGVPVLRWPGGCYADDYHWRDGIGPVEKRPKRVNIHWGGTVETNSFGTHEFIELCRLINAEPYLAGNVGSGSPQEMRDWVEYCNYPGGSDLAEERAANGAREPFKVRYWGVGNESWGCGGNMRPEEYATLYRRFAVYLKEFGGTTPYLIASGPSGGDIGWSRGLLDKVRGGFPDGLSMHYYEGGEDAATSFTAAHMNQQLAIFKKVEESILLQRAVLDGYPEGRKIGLILDEWGVWDRIAPEDEKRYGSLWQQSTMRSALAAGLGLNLFNRLADKLYMCNIAQIVNVLQSLLITEGAESDRCVRTTTYHAFSLFKAHRSRMAIRVEGKEAPSPGLSASASQSGNELVLSFVNPSTDEDIRVECTLKGCNAKEGAAEILQDADLNACNSFEKPNAVVVQKHSVKVDGSKVQLDMPRMSIATAVVRLG